MSELIRNVATKEDLATFIQELKSDNSSLVKWMFFFWITQIGATFVMFYLVLAEH